MTSVTGVRISLTPSASPLLWREAFAAFATFRAAQSPSASRDTAKSEVIPFDKA